MNKLISVRQFVLVLFVSMVTLKVLFLPSQLSKDLGNNSYFFVLLMMLLDFAILVVFLCIYNKYPNLSFYEIVKKSLGTIIAKIIMFIFFLFFVMKAWAVFQTNFSYLNENLYTNLTWIIFSIPILIVVFYLSKFGVNAFVRLVEVFAPVIIIGFVVSLCLGVSHADYTNLLPILNNNFLGGINKILKYAFWFGDYTIFIVFFGNIKEEKKLNLKIIIPVLIFLFLIVFFIATAFAVFSYSTVCHSNIISDFLQISPAPNDLGSFDWVLVLVWDISLFLFFTLNVLGAYYCFRQTFFSSHQDIAAVIILTIIFVSNILVKFDVYFSIVFTKTYLQYFCLPVQYLLPLIIFIFSFRIKKGDKYAKVSVEK